MNYHSPRHLKKVVEYLLHKKKVILENQCLKEHLVNIIPFTSILAISEKRKKEKRNAHQVALRIYVNPEKE